MTEQDSPNFKATGAAPIFPTADLPGAVERYRRMGFLVHAYPDDTGLDDAIYAFACYGPGELHLSRVACAIPQANTASAYFWVEDADATHAAWSSADLGGDLDVPKDTPYGLREFCYVDPDGNALRVGSPIEPREDEDR